MHSSVVVPISLLVCGLAGIGLSIQLLLNRIPRNPFYGFRTRLTLSSDEIWYPANRFAARLLIAWGVINGLIAVPAFWMLPLSDTTQLLLCLPPLSVVAFCGFGLRWVNKRYGRNTLQ